MADAKKGLLDSLLDLAKAAAPVVGHGLPEAIVLGEKVVATIDRARDMLDGDIPPPLGEERDRLEAKVKAHVADTAKRLRGE